MLIIFPEGTLDNVQKAKDLKKCATKLIPNENPCKLKKKYPQYLKIISCAAIKYKVRIIFNLIEKRDSDYFTSDVILDNTGYIGFRYRISKKVTIINNSSIVLEERIELDQIFYVTNLSLLRYLPECLSST